jgi:hypothetical protein
MIVAYIGQVADVGLAAIAGAVFGRAFVWCVIFVAGVHE